MGKKCMPKIGEYLPKWTIFGSSINTGGKYSPKNKRHTFSQAAGKYYPKAVHDKYSPASIYTGLDEHFFVKHICRPWKVANICQRWENAVIADISRTNVTKINCVAKNSIYTKRWQIFAKCRIHYYLPTACQLYARQLFERIYAAVQIEICLFLWLFAI